MAAKITTEETETKLDAAGDAQKRSPYMLNEDGSVKTREIAGDAGKKLVVPVLNPDYEVQGDGDAIHDSFKTADLVNVSPRVQPLRVLVKRKIKDPMSGEETLAWMQTGKTEKVKPGHVIKDYPLWPTFSTGPGNPASGWVVADYSAKTKDFPWPWTEKQITDYWTTGISNEIFEKMADAYVQLFQDNRPDVIRYINERNNWIRRDFEARQSL